MSTSEESSTMYIDIALHMHWHSIGVLGDVSYTKVYTIGVAYLASVQAMRGALGHLWQMNALRVDCWALLPHEHC